MYGTRFSEPTLVFNFRKHVNNPAPSKSDRYHNMFISQFVFSSSRVRFFYSTHFPALFFFHLSERSSVPNENSRRFESCLLVTSSANTLRCLALVKVKGPSLV